MTGLRREQVRFGTSSYVELHGKGRKERTVPLWPHTARALEAWFQERTGPGATVAFPNARGYQMVRDGVEYLLRQAAKRAAVTCSTLQNSVFLPT
jgi:integrase/recombinase XerD